MIRPRESYPSPFSLIFNNVFPNVSPLPDYADWCYIKVDSFLKDKWTGEPVVDVVYQYLREWRHISNTPDYDPDILRSEPVYIYLGNTLSVDTSGGVRKWRTTDVLKPTALDTFPSNGLNIFTRYSTAGLAIYRYLNRFLSTRYSYDLGNDLFSFIHIEIHYLDPQRFNEMSQIYHLLNQVYQQTGGTMIFGLYYYVEWERDPYYLDHIREDYDRETNFKR